MTKIENLDPSCCVNRLLPRFVALLLLALWLPATLHCNLEAAGLLTGHEECHEQTDCHDHHHQEDSSCALAHCDPIDTLAIKTGMELIAVDAPVLFACLCHLCVPAPLIVELPAQTPAQSDAPPELAPTWHFVTRAAPEARAPGSLV